jgi:hypothetical protein
MSFVIVGPLVRYSSFDQILADLDLNYYDCLLDTSPTPQLPPMIYLYIYSL